MEIYPTVGRDSQHIATGNEIIRYFRSAANGDAIWKSSFIRVASSRQPPNQFRKCLQHYRGIHALCSFWTLNGLPLAESNQLAELLLILYYTYIYIYHCHLPMPQSRDAQASLEHYDRRRCVDSCLSASFVCERNRDDRGCPVYLLLDEVRP